MNQDTPLKADCARCVGLCCVAPPFTKGAEFAITKREGVPCPNLSADDRCSIHDRLRPAGFSGCAAYDCFGAGQTVTAQFGGRRVPEMFDIFHETRRRHELLWHLHEAQRYSDDPALQTAIDDVPHRRTVNELLLRVSAQVRGNGGRDLTGLDLAGKDMRRADLRNAMLFNACLIGTDLSHADLRGADLRAADPRGARLQDADLTGALFLTQMQIESALGNKRTKLPKSVTRPTFWR
jgi:uncharacterized protein YjbI with pentapeptide repeats